MNCFKRGTKRALLGAFALVFGLALATAGCQKKGDGKMRAIIHTNMGQIECELFPDKAPKTVENFAGLAEGTKEWRDPKTSQSVKDKALYSGTIFHRVISGFMIQGGDPMGTGFGGPGYKFEDEFDPSLKFDRPWLLAMANAGPNTNGSQFFITVAPTPHLNNRHTIFGDCSKSKDVVLKISQVETGRQDRPKQDVVVEKIDIQR